MTETVKIVRADEGRVVEDEVAARSAKRRDVRRVGLPYRVNRRAMKSIARYFAPSRAASFQRKIFLTSFCVFWSRRAIHRRLSRTLWRGYYGNRSKRRIHWYTCRRTIGEREKGEPVVSMSWHSRSLRWKQIEN